MEDDSFELYDLKVEVVHRDTSRPMVCRHQVGDHFYLRGGNLEFPVERPRFGYYAMLAVLPFLMAKQRPTQRTDWMSTDAEIGCTDPNCGGAFRITRLDKQTYRHSEYTKEALPPA
ncbi:TIGR04076 family protein [Acuticoccus kandeliae]|uniref:TIGR04076 family protein n=1 Tax=Acuticoccus kandeliae TaxID=2073160 RepID=UPI000D3E47E2|nr:TIGR04076 family protein [Acuticoccus kandeliae]